MTSGIGPSLDPDEAVNNHDLDVYRVMTHLRLSHVLARGGTALAETYKTPSRGEVAWGVMLDEATRQVVKDIVQPLASENARLRAAIAEFLAFEDGHVEGPVVDDSYVRGPVCADEDCGRYWPCPVEELRRATTDEGA